MAQRIQAMRVKNWRKKFINKISGRFYCELTQTLVFGVLWVFAKFYKHFPVNYCSRFLSFVVVVVCLSHHALLIYFILFNMFPYSLPVTQDYRRLTACCHSVQLIRVEELKEENDELYKSIIQLYIMTFFFPKELSMRGELSSSTATGHASRGADEEENPLVLFIARLRHSSILGDRLCSPRAVISFSSCSDRESISMVIDSHLHGLFL